MNITRTANEPLITRSYLHAKNHAFSFKPKPVKDTQVAIFDTKADSSQVGLGEKRER